MTNSGCPWEPPLAGTDAEHLVGALDRLRTTFRWKADDLDSAGLQTRIGASSLTLGGLLKHLAFVEEHCSSTRLSGAPPGAPWDAVDWDADPDWEFNSAADDTPEQLYALWDGAVERSRLRLDAALADGGLDQLIHVSGPDGRHASLRRLVCDLIEEYGRQPATPTSSARPWTGSSVRTLPLDGGYGRFRTSATKEKASTTGMSSETPRARWRPCSRSLSTSLSLTIPVSRSTRSTPRSALQPGSTSTAQASCRPASRPASPGTMGDKTELMRHASDRTPPTRAHAHAAGGAVGGDLAWVVARPSQCRDQLAGGLGVGLGCAASCPA